jgi:putative selenate reductase
VPIPGSEFLMQGDSIIVAIGQKPDIAFLNGSVLSLKPDGSVGVDPKTGLAGVERVYAGGDAARGPAIIIQACADGRRAAEAICAELGIPFHSLPAHPTPMSSHEFLRVKNSRARKEPQRKPEILPVDERSGFDLIEQTLAEEDARAEAARCLQCSALCDKCVEVCPNRANYAYTVAPACWKVPVLAIQNGKLAVVREQALAITQTRQIVHVDDFCNECGNCATFCVHQGKPYADKPRLFLNEADFQRETDNAFHIAGNTIRRREGGRESSLTLNGDAMAFENAHVRVTLSSTFEVRSAELKEAFDGELPLVSAAEMAVILRGVNKP